MIRIVPVALLLMAVAVGFGASTSAVPLGPCRIHMTGAMGSLSRQSQVFDTAMPDGSIVVGSSYTQGKSVIVHLRRVLLDCRSFAVLGTVITGKSGPIDAIAATPDGRILVGGNIGHAALVGRFSLGGGLDRSFGTDGWTRIQPNEKRRYGIPQFFGVTSIAVGPSGTIVIGGTDGAAHCCVRSFVSELTPDGALLPTFGHSGSRVIPAYAGSYTANVAPNPDRSVYVLDQYQGSGCGGPTVTRFFSDGSLDSRFNKAVARTIKRISGRHMLFAPSLVPDGSGGFTLAGGFDRTCGIFRHWLISGASVRVGSSGQAVGGVMHFRSPHDAFFSPAAVGLPSGRIVVAGSGPTDAFVQVLGPDGSRDPNVGDHGLLRFGTPPRVHVRYPSVDLLAAGGGAWLVTAFPREIDLTPIPVR